jgi:hypothetical protein
MALGETIGYGAKLSMNGQVYHPHQHEREVHIALMGDPTLRLHPVIPPGNLSALKNGTGVVLTWQNSSDSAIQGYNVYRATSANGPFTKVNSAPIQSNTFTESENLGSTYMVRAVKLESTPSGTYFNLSQGAFATVGTGTPNTAIPLKITRNDAGFAITFPSSTGALYNVESTSDFRSWSNVSNVTATGSEASVPLPKASGRVFFRVRRAS